MKKAILFLFTLCLSLYTQAQEQIKVNILMAEQSDPVALRRAASWLSSKQERRTYVVDALKRQAEASQQELMTLLHELEQNGLVSEIRPLWIVNSISCYATQDVILSLETRPDILALYPCEETPGLLEEESTLADRGDGREIAENLLKVNADKVWELGHTGQGVLIAIIDTGVNLSHADLQGRFWDGGT